MKFGDRGRETEKDTDHSCQEVALDLVTDEEEAGVAGAGASHVQGVIDRGQLQNHPDVPGILVVVKEMVMQRNHLDQPGGQHLLDEIDHLQPEKTRQIMKMIRKRISERSHLMKLYICNCTIMDIIIN